jgi:RNA polymerase sigma-70 factor (ECF subfamily)
MILHEDTVDEKQAIQQLKNGDISGLEFLVACYQVKAVRTAYLITRDPGLAEDIVQDSFLQAYRSIRGFDSARSFEPWFMRSVVNASVKAGDDAEDLFSQLVEQAELVEAQVESIEVQNQIWDAMQKLSPRQRAVIVQRYFLDMSEKEMAEEAGSAVGTVKWMLNAARERLRGLLGVDTEGANHE